MQDDITNEKKPKKIKIPRTKICTAGSRDKGK